MIKNETFRQIALSLPEVSEQPHFEKTSFRVKKKIFATLAQKERRAVLKFSEMDQAVFCSFNRAVIYPVKGAWGKRGWTYIELKTIPKDLLQDALITSYCEVAPKALSEKYRKA